MVEKVRTKYGSSYRPGVAGALQDLTESVGRYIGNRASETTTAPTESGRMTRRQQQEMQAEGISPEQRQRTDHENQ